MAEKILCPKCGAQMNHHANKLNYTTALSELEAVGSDYRGILDAVHTCPNCRNVAVRKVP